MDLKDRAQRFYLNAEEEPENEDYPKNPEFKKRFGPRGVLDARASDTDDPTEDPRFGRVGKQTVKDTGPLTRKRMETADEEFLEHTKSFIRRNQDAGMTFKTHLDGYNFLPYLTGNTDKGPRKEFFYWSDDGQLVGMRYQQWKIVFAEQRARQMMVWMEPFLTLRIPKIFNLRTDPFERADTDSNNYNRWLIQRAYLFGPTQVVVGNFLQTFAEFPMRQKPAKFNVDDVIKKMSESSGN